MRVLWTHNFDPLVPNSQIFLKAAGDGIRARGIDLHFEYLGNLRSVPAVIRARKRVRRLAANYDLVHAQYGSACGLVTSAVKGVPKVLWIRGNDWSVHSASIGFHYVHTRLARMMTLLSLEHYDLIVTVSRRTAAEIQEYVPAIPVIAMPTPIDLERFVPLDKREARARLGFTDCGERWVLFNALNLDDPIKRFDLAKRAFDLAHAKCGNLRLRIATNLPHADVPLFAAACDVTLCTSETEGWPNSVKEALACNVPFVATDVSDLRDIARVDPSCRVCPPDPAVLADNICDVLSRPEAPDVRRHVAAMSQDVLSEQLVVAYQSLVNMRVKAVASRSAGSVH
jgi:glycosyltransferase involved in cell wall biosynthesis